MPTKIYVNGNHQLIEKGDRIVPYATKDLTFGLPSSGKINIIDKFTQTIVAEEIFSDFQNENGTQKFATKQEAIDYFSAFSTGGGNGNGVTTIETSLPVDGIVFDRNRVYDITQDDIVNIDVATSGHTANTQLTTIVKVVGDSTHDINFTPTTITLGGDDLDNTKTNSIVLGYLNGLINATNQVSDVIVVDVLAPTVVSATIENSSPDELVVVFSEAVNITNVTGLSLSDDLSAITIDSIISGDGTNTITFQLSASVENEDAGNFVYDGTNTITDTALSPNALVSSTTSITNNVSDLITINFNGDFATNFDIVTALNALTESAGKLQFPALSGAGVVNIMANRATSIYSKVLADTEVFEFEFDDFTLLAPNTQRDSFLIGLLGSNGKLATYRSALGDIFKTTTYTNDYTGTGVAIDNNDSTALSGFSGKIKYTRNAGTPANSTVQFYQKTGGVYVLERTYNIDLGATIKIISTFFHTASRVSGGASIETIRINNA